MSEADKTYTGGCLCGAIRYEAQGKPDQTGFCHCRMCQRGSGSAFAIYARFPSARVRFQKGAPKRYNSSTFAERGFCAECGTPLTFQYLAARENIGLAAGSFDDPSTVAPELHDGIESWQPWLIMDDGLPRHRTEDDPKFAAMRAGA